MALSDNFKKIFDKSQSIGHACECLNNWIVTESKGQATMTQLAVKADGTFLGFDQCLVQGVKDITVRMSSILEDKDCD